MAHPPPGAAGVRLLEALIAAEHSIAVTAEATRWDLIAATYAHLEALTGSAVVRLNRAEAVAENDGPRAGLALLDGLDDALLPDNHRLPATRAELLTRAGDVEGARTAYQEAISRCPNPVERSHLHRRLAMVEPSGVPP